MDFILRALTEIDDKLRAAWQGNRCLACPLAELAALAAATKQLYVEQTAALGVYSGERVDQQVNPHDHWTNYRRKP